MTSSSSPWVYCNAVEVWTMRWLEGQYDVSLFHILAYGSRDVRGCIVPLTQKFIEMNWLWNKDLRQGLPVWPTKSIIIMRCESIISFGVAISKVSFLLEIFGLTTWGRSWLSWHLVTGFWLLSLKHIGFHLVQLDNCRCYQNPSR